MDSKIDKAIEEELRLPEGFSQRMESFVDSLQEQEITVIESRRKPMRSVVLWIASSAAVVAVAIFSLFGIDNQTQLKDTYADVAQAEQAVDNALRVMSQNFSKGVGTMSLAENKIEKTNKIINKTLKKDEN